MRAKITCGSKGEVDPLLKVGICGCDELLELNGAGDESGRSLRFRYLLDGVGVNNVLDAIDGGGELCSMALNGGCVDVCGAKGVKKCGLEHGHRRQGDFGLEHTTEGGVGWWSWDDILG